MDIVTNKTSREKQYPGIMDIYWPLVISAAAVFVTLIYTSYLDIRERRVPFVHWLPMLAIGAACTAFLLWQTTGNSSLVAGYLALIAAFLYSDYLDNRGRTDSLYLTRYYRRENMWPFLAITLVLPAISWFILAPVIDFRLLPWYAMVAGILILVSHMDNRGMFEPDPDNPKKGDYRAQTIGRWYFIPVIIAYAVVAASLLFSQWGSPAAIVLFSCIFCGVFYTFGRMHLFGGADAWALVFIAFCVPVFPFEPLLGTPPLGFFAFSVLINALILNLVTPLGIFAINVLKGNRAPLMYRFFGFPVTGERIRQEWGFVMEDFEESEGKVRRKFIGFWDAIRRMYDGENRIYTKDLREHPEEYQKELDLYRRAGTVWISYAVPFIIPITAGFVTAIVFGDILLFVMNLLI